MNTETRDCQALESLFDNSHDMFFVALDDGRFLHGNNSALATVHLTRDELQVRSWQDVLTPESREEFQAALKRLSDDEPVVTAHVQMLGKDGVPRLVDLQITQREEVLYAIGTEVTKDDRVREELDVAESRYRALIELAPVGIYSINSEGVCDFVNDKFLEVAGWTKEQLFNNEWISAIHPEDRDEVVENWQQFQAGHALRDLNFRYVHESGDVRHVVSRNKIMRTRTGRLLGMMGVINDVTELTKAGSLLKEAASLGRVGAWEVEARTMTPKWSLEMQRIFEVPDDFIPTIENSYQFYPPEAQQILSDCVQNAVTHGEPWDVEIPAQTATGRALWLRVAGDPEMVNQYCTRIVGIVQDLTEYDQARRAERSASQKLKLLYESSPLGIALFAPDGPCMKANGAYQQLLGYTESELRDKTYIDLVAPEFQEAFTAKLDRLTSKNRFKSIELELVRKDGQHVPVAATGSVVYDNDDKPLVWCIVEDITPKRQVEETRAAHERALAETNKALEDSNKELEEFTYAASHDLSEPLRTIAGFCELLEEDIDEDNKEAAKDDIRIIINATRRLQRLVKDLLALSRSGKQQLKMSACDLNAVLAQVRQNISESITQSGARIESESLPTVMADAEHVGRVFQNLLGNAITYQLKGNTPEIKVWATREDDMWAVHIKDNGIGIEPKYHQTVFDAFKRLHPQEVYDGSGLGLAICRKTVERHGGSIQLESAPGQGSTFTITLPASMATQEEE
jgi:PAS domain S-box-containing protein